MRRGRGMLRTRFELGFEATPRGLTAAVRLLAVACAALGVVEIASGAPLPGLHPYPLTPASVAWVSGGVLLAAAVYLLLRPFSRRAGAALAASWLVGLACTVVAAARAPGDATLWVAAAECATLAAAAWVAHRLPTGDGVLFRVFGALLIGFGVVHWLYRPAIASLIPGWIPAAELWPWATGAVLLACGGACLLGRAVRPAAFAVAAMFASWIVLLHAARILEDPTSAFEWTFGLTALALTAVALTVATAAPDRRRP